MWKCPRSLYPQSGNLKQEMNNTQVNDIKHPTSIADDDLVHISGFDMIHQKLLVVGPELLLRKVSIHWSLEDTRNISGDFLKLVQTFRKKHRS